MEPIAIYALRGIALILILLAILATQRVGRARDVAIGNTLCRNGGYAGWSMEDGTPFTSQLHCMRYVTEGGTLVSKSGLPPGPGDGAAKVPRRRDRPRGEPST